MSLPLPTPAARSPAGLDLRQSPLAPVALAATAGLLLDRYFHMPVPLALGAAVAALAAWTVSRYSRPPGLAPLYLWLAVAALAALHHRAYRDLLAADDLGYAATAEPRLVRLRGTIAEEPAFRRPPVAVDPLRTLPEAESTLTVLEADRLQGDADWLPVSGRARLTLPGRRDDLHTGDGVELIGWLQSPAGPANPGERDAAAALRDRQIHAEVRVRHTSDAVVRLDENHLGSPAGWLGLLRGWGQRALNRNLPEPEAGLAQALLLGEGSTMTPGDWDRYARTGVLHVLAISGQHLVVLASFGWWLLGLIGVRRVHGAWIIALGLLGYALLTGGRPPVMRAAVTVCAWCGAIVLRRPTVTLNLFALSWLVVLVLDPTDVFGAGCQLSFLAVAVLIWGVAVWLRPPQRSPLGQLLAEARPPWRKALDSVLHPLGQSYAVTLIVGLALAPLLAWWYHMISPVGLVIGPPVVLLSSVALIAGFGLLLAEVLGGWASWPFAQITRWSLAGCDGLVRLGDALPNSCIYVSDVPTWWVVGFYLGLLAVLFLPKPGLARVSLPAWLCVGLLGGAFRQPADELRCTFLAVGHGGCTVLETPDGRALLYDAGAMAGPDVTRRQIAPFLWHRGVRRIDEVFLSHADLDHFNGLPALLERFAVGQVTTTPSFSEKEAAGVRATIKALESAGVPVRRVSAGDRLAAGGVDLEVLHPPSEGPPGNENARSLVLVVRHAGHTVVLTGDLEGTGLTRVLAERPVAADVLMAPHHGSRIANVPALAVWAEPRLVVVCQGPPRWPARGPNPYEAKGVPVWGTWPHGAVTLISRRDGLLAETFKTGERRVVRHGGGPGP